MYIKIRGTQKGDWLYIEVERIRVRQINGKEYAEWGASDRAVLRFDDPPDDHQMVWADTSYGKVQGHTVVFDTVAFLCNDDGKTIEKIVPRGGEPDTLKAVGPEEPGSYAYEDQP